MKFLIIAFFPKTMVPYAGQYENEIKAQNNDFDILFWDRFVDAPLEKRNNEYVFHCKCTLGGNRIKKIYPFYLFRKTVIRIINKNRYDKLIILSTLPGVLLCSLLLKRYKGKFILDIRDYTYEKYGFYRRVVQDLIEKSYFTAISSRGFKSFLGENKKLIINHNISNLLAVTDKATLFKEKKEIIIGFIGSIRYFEENVRLINELANGTRYRLFYAGSVSAGCDLKGYCRSKGYNNVCFSGVFQNYEKPFLYQKVDFINALYGNQLEEVQTALPNKLYDCLLFKKPILVSEGTYLAEVVKKYDIGLALSSKDSYLDKITEYVDAFDSQKFSNSAKKLLQIVEKEQKAYCDEIRKFVRSSL